MLFDALSLGWIQETAFLQFPGDSAGCFHKQTPEKPRWALFTFPDRLSLTRNAQMKDFAKGPKKNAQSSDRILILIRMTFGAKEIWFQGLFPVSTQQ